MKIGEFDNSSDYAKAKLDLMIAISDIKLKYKLVEEEVIELLHSCNSDAIFNVAHYARKAKEGAEGEK